MTITYYGYFDKDESAGKADSIQNIQKKETPYKTESPVLIVKMVICGYLFREIFPESTVLSKGGNMVCIAGK